MNTSSLAITPPNGPSRAGAPVPGRPLREASGCPLASQAAAWIRHRDASNALPADQIVGRVVRFVVADGMAVYRITSVAPLRLEHLPECGQYHLPYQAMRQLRLGDVISRIERDRQRCERYRRDV